MSRLWATQASIHSGSEEDYLGAQNAVTFRVARNWYVLGCLFSYFRCPFTASMVGSLEIPARVYCESVLSSWMPYRHLLVWIATGLDQSVVCVKASRSCSSISLYRFISFSE